MPDQAALKALVKKALLKGNLSPFARTIHDSLVRLELAAQRFVDRRYSEPALETDSRLLSDVTVLVKTFERPAIVKRLLASIQRLYPDLSIIVVDDSRHPRALDGVRTVTLPYDSGLSAGRNEGLRHVTTKYFLLLDDDFVFYRHTRLEEALALMERFPQIDIMGGEVVNLPFFRGGDYSKVSLLPTSASATMPRGSSIGGMPVYDKVANFFVGRTERVALVGWDPRLKKLEHADFFTRAKGVLTSAFNKNLKVLHAQTPFDASYMAKRKDISVEQALLREKYFPTTAWQNIVITMSASDCQPMQFCALFEGQCGVFDFAGNMIKGDMKSESAQQLVREWAQSHQQELLDAWRKSISEAASRETPIGRPPALGAPAENPPLDTGCRVRHSKHACRRS